MSFVLSTFIFNVLKNRRDKLILCDGIYCGLYYFCKYIKKINKRLTWACVSHLIINHKCLRKYFNISPLILLKYLFFHMLNFVRDHSMNIHVQFGFNQVLSFWEKLFIHFLVSTYEWNAKILFCSTIQFGKFWKNIIHFPRA